MYFCGKPGPQDHNIFAPVFFQQLCRNLTTLYMIRGNHGYFFCQHPLKTDYRHALHSLDFLSRYICIDDHAVKTARLNQIQRIRNSLLNSQRIAH